jgi:hypothetical protein
VRYLVRQLTDRLPGWFERSSWAHDAWQGAQERFYETYYGGRLYESPRSEFAQRAIAQLEIDRANYRRMILGWFHKLCIPLSLSPVECTPNAVAELAAESWDLGKLSEKWPRND